VPDKARFLNQVLDTAVFNAEKCCNPLGMKDNLLEKEITFWYHIDKYLEQEITD